MNRFRSRCEKETMCAASNGREGNSVCRERWKGKMALSRLYRGSIEVLSRRRRRRWQEGGSSHKVKSALSDSAGCWVLESGSLKSACQEGNAFHPERGTIFHQ
mmetsp:Transcript_4192/g.8919  ORF Transcript_4192/g.8919 Transcript_4192/m.8919 type:complete len:103 (-) Transcript_4192:216-524(-)